MPITVSIKPRNAPPPVCARSSARQTHPHKRSAWNLPCTLRLPRSSGSYTYMFYALGVMCRDTGLGPSAAENRLGEIGVGTLTSKYLPGDRTTSSDPSQQPASCTQPFPTSPHSQHLGYQPLTPTHQLNHPASASPNESVCGPQSDVQTLHVTL